MGRVSRIQKVKVDALGKFITDTLLRLTELVSAEHGTLHGTPFGIYHGPVNQIDDGPVEICFPVQGMFTAQNEVVVKALPAQQAATITVGGDACRFPAILAAYDAAHDWITANGCVPDRAAREVWLGPDENGPMMIAWPFIEKEQPA